MPTFNEKIIRIEECSFSTKDSDHNRYDGYRIITENQTIEIGIYNGQSCCEQWGYLTSEDDTTIFNNSQLLNISITDTDRSSHNVTENFDYREYSSIFIDIETSKGVLQFVAYNNHNGYYGHTVLVQSNKENNTLIEESI